MASEKTNIVYLLQRYKKGKCTEAELRQLQRYVSTERYANELDDALGMSLLDSGYDVGLAEEKLERLYQSIAAKTTRVKVQNGRRFTWAYAAAASVLLVAAISLYFYNGYSGRIEPSLERVANVDVAPGGNRATLTLADGRVVKLSEQQKGIVMDGQIRYDDGAMLLDNQRGGDIPADPSKTVFYTLATPRGGTYQITLPDSTKVWLNAESSLTYPAQFTGDERVVTLDGEGYFAVAHDERKVFKVISNGQEVDVLGTEFNVSAYSDAAETQTTLVQGRIKVALTGNDATNLTSVVLDPGQQAANSRGTQIDVRNVKVASYVGWKKGVFYFDETRLAVAIDQLSRWYDLEVHYQGQIPDTHFYGEINRDKSLQEVLEILQEGGVRFSIEKEGGQNKLIVLAR